MFRHVLKLIWNRRKTIRLVIVEIAAAFLVVFVVAGLSLHAWGNYRRPLGFNYENIWRVSVSNPSFGAQPGKPPAGQREAMDDILVAVRRVPGVLGAHLIVMAPFGSGEWSSNLGRRGTLVNTMINTMTAGAVAELGVRIIEGRNFGPQDEGRDYQAALVNRDFVELAFGGASPLGKRINLNLDREMRPVGVIEDFRQNGEFTEKTPYAILLDNRSGFVPSELFVKVAPGTDRRVEESIVAAVRATASGFNATVTPWEEMRESNHLETLLPLRIGATLAVFLLAMVALGLIGIVWQDVVRRTREIGLRRAAGASSGAVRAQILLEVMVIGGAGILIGSLVAIQIPLLSIVKQIDRAAAVPALGLSAVLILLLAAGAALYPARLASRREPADALRYE